MNILLLTTMHYVYIIKSIECPDRIYVGQTNDLQERLSRHNSGATPHTSKYKPWEVIFYCAFKDKTKALEFEAFLKSGSGREFKNRRLI